MAATDSEVKRLKSDPPYTSHSHSHDQALLPPKPDLSSSAGHGYPATYSRQPLSHQQLPSPGPPYQDHSPHASAPPYSFSRRDHAAPVDPPLQLHHEPSYTRPATASAAPPPPVSQPPFRTLSLPAGQDGPPHMAHPPQHQYPGSEPHVNGVAPHSLPHHESLPTPVAHGQPYPSGSHYAPPLHYGPAAGSYLPAPGQPRKKPVRATQACDNCRQRKQKCDEARPCQFCSENTLKCDYREVPPPKQDRALMAIMDKMTTLTEEVRAINQKVCTIERRVGPASEQTSGSQAGNRSSMVDSASDDLTQPVETRDPSMPPPYSHATELRTHDSSPMNISAAPVPQTGGVPLQSVRSEGRVDDSQLTIPYQHSTPAHKLLLIWHSIREFTGNVNVDTNDPLKVEYNRGLLRVHGRGDGPDTGEYGQHGPGSPSHSSDGDDAGISSTHSGSAWGTGFAWFPGLEQRRSLSGDLVGSGGLGLHGYPQLDEVVIRKLHESFMRNIYVLHPFLEKSRLAKMINRFINTYSPGKPGSRPGFVQDERVGTKRKRDGGLYRPQPGATSDAPETPYRPVLEHSITNAIILLVLALGQVCEHTEPLPGLAQAHENPSTAAPSPNYSHRGTTPVTVKQSPGSTHSSVHSPNTSGINAPSSRSGSSDWSLVAGAKNQDKVPGLAYYAYAADILGELHGGLDLSHTQAFLLAGLYMGQLARVLESWSWINAACRACQVLVQMESVVNSPAEEEGAPPTEPLVLSPKLLARRDMIRLAYWTCLQLESDILAELDQLPHSGISRFENRISLPTGVCYDMPPAFRDDAHEVMMLYYSAQIQLRKILNQVHSSLYRKVPETPSEHPRIEPEPEYKTYEHLSWLLAKWRSILPPGLQWNDDDPPHADINVARMRAKYYGALYVINRPYLYQALHSSRGYRKDINSSAATAAETCIRAAKQSTVALDGLKAGRFIITNIFGTMHAQFGNCLVLTAAHLSRQMQHLVHREELDHLLERTVRKLKDLAPMSAALKVDAQILEMVTNNIKDMHWTLQRHNPPSANSSFTAGQS